MDNAALVTQAYADFAAKDFAALDALFSPKLEWIVSEGFPYAGRYLGFEAVRDGVFAKVPGDWEGFHHELERSIDCGADILVVGTYFGTWKRNGRSIRAPFVHQWTLREGKVTHFRQFVDGPSTHAATEGFVHA